MIRVLVAAAWRGTSFALAALLLAAFPSLVVSAPAHGQLVEREVSLGDRTVRALCTSGPREAVLLQGPGAGADVWRPVLERLEGEVGACAYDRAPPPVDRAGGRGWFELMEEMRRAHETLGFQRAYTLVGHGVGGMYARLYATARPSEVAALVLVDPAHEDLPEETRYGMPAAAWEDWMRRRSEPNADGVRETDLAKRARASRPRDIPTTVITARLRPNGGGWDERFIYEGARRVHATLLEGNTRGRHVPASRSGHDVHLDEPDLVAREISRLVRLSRGQ